MMEQSGSAPRDTRLSLSTVCAMEIGYIALGKDQSAKDRDAKDRNAKDRDAKDRDAKDRDAKDRDAKDRSRRERGERERERERGGPHAVQLPQGGRSQKPLLSPWRGGVVVPFYQYTPYFCLAQHCVRHLHISLLLLSQQRRTVRASSSTFARCLKRRCRSPPLVS